MKRDDGTPAQVGDTVIIDNGVVRFIPPTICNCQEIGSGISIPHHPICPMFAAMQSTNDTWNEAIEAAAAIVDQANRDGPYNAITCAPDIRKLKRGA